MEWIMLNWKLILAAAIALTFVLFIGGYYWKLKREITELVNTIEQAIEDGDVDDAELAAILKEGHDVGRTLKEITFAITKLLTKV